MISGLSAGHAAATMRASGVMPSSSALVSLITTHGGGAVVERAGVAGGDRAVGAEHRLQAGEASRRVVPARGPSSFDTTVPSGSVTGVISRSKKPFSCDCDRALLRARGELVHLLAADASRTRPTFSAVWPMAM